MLEELTNLLTNISLKIDNNMIVTERDLEECFEVTSEAKKQRVQATGGFTGKSVLDVLGYDENHVTSQKLPKKLVSGTSYYKPDHVIHSENLSHGIKYRVILDLKRPGSNLNNKNYFHQIQKYCTDKEINAHIGIIFNGKSMRIYINPNHVRRPLKSFLSEDEYAISIDDDISKIIEFLLLLNYDSVFHANNIAVEFAKIKKDHINLVQRRKEILNFLSNVLKSEKIMAPMLLNADIWTGITKPTKKELKTAWQDMYGHQ